MLARVGTAILGGFLFAAGVRMMIVQFTDPQGPLIFALVMGGALLIGGAWVLTAALRPRR